MLRQRARRSQTSESGASAVEFALVSTLLFLTPPTTALWAFLMFGTVPGLLALPGAAVCALAVTLVVRRTRAPSPG